MTSTCWWARASNVLPSLVRVGLEPEWDVPASWGLGMSHGVGLGGGKRQGSMGLLICLFILLCMFGCCWERKRRYLFKQSLETEVILSSLLKKTGFFLPHRRPLSVFISEAVKTPPPTFYRLFCCLNDIPLPPLLLRLILLLPRCVLTQRGMSLVFLFPIP